MVQKSSPAINKYSTFRGWKWTRLDAERVRVWNNCECSECSSYLILHEFVLCERNDTALHLSGVKWTSVDGLEILQKATIPYAGGPTLCPGHYEAWLQGKVLPSETGVSER